MIKPTVGRVVYVKTKEMLSYQQPFAAIISYVHADDYINLFVINPDGKPFAASSVFLKQEETIELPKDTKIWAEWMPYQIGRAKDQETK